jgi:hypothetical protein
MLARKISTWHGNFLFQMFQSNVYHLKKKWLSSANFIGGGNRGKPTELPHVTSTLAVIGADFIGSCQSNHHTITITFMTAAI